MSGNEFVRKRSAHTESRAAAARGELARRNATKVVRLSVVCPLCILARHEPKVECDGAVTRQERLSVLNQVPVAIACGNEREAGKGAWRLENPLPSPTASPRDGSAVLGAG